MRKGHVWTRKGRVRGEDDIRTRASICHSYTLQYLKKIHLSINFSLCHRKGVKLFFVLVFNKSAFKQLQWAPFSIKAFD